MANVTKKKCLKNLGIGNCNMEGGISGNLAQTTK